MLRFSLAGFGSVLVLWFPFPSTKDTVEKNLIEKINCQIDLGTICFVGGSRYNKSTKKKATKVVLLKWIVFCKTGKQKS